MTVASAQTVGKRIAARETDEDGATSEEDAATDEFGNTLESFLQTAHAISDSRSAKRCLDFAWMGMSEVARGDYKRMRFCTVMRHAVQMLLRAPRVNMHVREGGEGCGNGAEVLGGDEEKEEEEANLHGGEGGEGADKDTGAEVVRDDEEKEEEEGVGGRRGEDGQDVRRDTPAAVRHPHADVEHGGAALCANLSHQLAEPGVAT